MTCRSERPREDWVDVKIVVDHQGSLARSVYENAGRSAAVAAWLRDVANLIHETDITP